MTSCVSAQSGVMLTTQLVSKQAHYWEKKKHVVRYILRELPLKKKAAVRALVSPALYA